MASKALIIFIKNPVLGKVKTRLASSVGNDEALSIYLKLLEYTRNLVSSLSVDCYLYYSTIVENDEWSSTFFHKRQQLGEDLGARMETAFNEVLSNHEKAVIIGSDCGDLTASHIEAAFEGLNDHDVVLGPAIDGGYYLLGMKTLEPILFRNMEWSTEQVAKVTLQRVKEQGKKYFILEELSDIDFEEDWRALQKRWLSRGIML